jgi:hypothetical protein
MANQASITGLLVLGVLLAVSSIAEASVNLRGIKFSKWTSGRRAGIGIIGVLLMIFPGLLLLKATRQGEKQGDKTLNCNVSGSANTAGPNSAATVSGCSTPPEPAQR